MVFFPATSEYLQYQFKCFFFYLINKTIENEGTEIGDKNNAITKAAAHIYVKKISLIRNYSNVTFGGQRLLPLCEMKWNCTEWYGFPVLKKAVRSLVKIVIIPYLHVAMLNFPSTVRTCHCPVDTISYSVLFKIPSFHRLTTRLTLYITKLATIFMVLWIYKRMYIYRYIYFFFK